jgi:hypothetical protein
MNRSLFFYMLVFLHIVLLISPYCLVGEEPESNTVNAKVFLDRLIRNADPRADEGYTRNQCKFADDPDSYIALPFPIAPDKPLKVTQSENKVVSYNVLTGEETVTEYPESPPSLEEWVEEVVGHDVNLPELVLQGKNDIENFTDLSLISNPEDSPWRMNCKLFFTIPAGNRVASGALIDPMHVLTAGHCVHEGSGGSWATNMVVVPGYENGVEPYGDAGAAQMLSWLGWTVDGNFDHDIGIISLDRPLGSMTGWFQYNYSDSCPFFTGNTFHNAGYPAEAPYSGQYMYYWYGTFDECEESGGVWYGNEIRILKRGYGGQSGSGA